MVKFNDFEHVFKPIKVGNLILKNRIQFAPMVSNLSTSTGAVSETCERLLRCRRKRERVLSRSALRRSII